jgi:DNA-binding MarR family transcriptional regulator
MQHDDITIDLETRRILVTDGDQQPRAEYAIQRVRRSSTRYGRRWLLLFVDAADKLAASALSVTALRTAFWCLAHLDSRTWQHVMPARIAEHLNLDRSAASRALGELVTVGFLLRRPVPYSVGSEYRVSLGVAWTGTAGGYQQQRRLRATEISNFERGIHEAGRVKPAPRTVTVSASKKAPKETADGTDTPAATRRKLRFLGLLPSKK